MNKRQRTDLGGPAAAPRVDARRGPWAPAAQGYRLVAWVFLRALALIYIAAFASLAVQVQALAGADGIFPLEEQLIAAAGEHGLGALLAYPSLFWLASGDWALLAVARGGCVLAVLLLFGIWQRGLLILLYLAYLSLYHAGQMFTNFQWDFLLLETGFLAIFLPGGSRVVVWLFRFVLFKLRFLSGVSKLISGDPTWSGLTALNHYFETQPLPHAGAWVAHQLPEWLLRAGTAGTLFVELIVPFFMVLPRPWRLFAAWATILWQVLIIASSNHNFINLLTIVLCLFLFDDRALRRVLPARWADRFTAASPLPERPRRTVAAATLAAALIVVPAGLAGAAEMIARRPLPVLASPFHALEPLRIANRYHVFPTIETERISVQIDASLDGEHWVPLDFRYAPDDPMERPRFIVPHQPRVDWMLWFVPMGPVFLDWLARFGERLLDGSPTVTALLEQPPFDDRPPRLLRLRVYRYRFATPTERAETGAWWMREDLGPFYPLPVLRADPIRPGRRALPAVGASTGGPVPRA
jgi:hypothetical protein